ncbi:MFS transporter [Algoriphagus sediminis]|uniref:MFS transporter n=1 Tax=Algoriphagus sediminis TaxID=3057113 RepID=A0ABT7YDQ9_9BACT|nr:MFS transporter [Algoriphagus sediminis]MDN3204649.1 MFS transporter [Algoriphagus sediminis]
MKAISQRRALILIVLAQFLGTSVWFAGNAAIPQFEHILGMDNLTSTLTSLVQIGFISGSLIFAIFSVPDRFSPSSVFLASSLLTAFANIIPNFLEPNLEVLYFSRFSVGFFLAGIYPVGMKIASDYFDKGLGVALGLLVGALVMGTAFPYLLGGLALEISWTVIFFSTSFLAVTGGIILGFFVPDGPFRKPMPNFDLRLIPKLFKIPSLRKAAFGYFGHMWELYTFWAFAPLLITYLNQESGTNISPLLLAFCVVASGGLSCVAGGYLARSTTSKFVASLALFGSGLSCILLLVIPTTTPIIWIFLLIFWGISVTADSPQLSTLVAQSVPQEYKGTALTMVNSLGFGITVISLFILESQIEKIGIIAAMSLLAIGPLVGFLSLNFGTKKRGLK